MSGDVSDTENKPTPGDLGAGSYGDAFADVYDTWYANITDGPATATFLAARCITDFPVLELGVGTGRLVGPLRAAGLFVIGLDASASMLAHSASTHPGTPLIRADLSRLGAGRSSIGGALCAFNTMFNLPSARDQQEMMASVAAALVPGAPLVIEAITGVGLEGAPERSVGLSDVPGDRTVISATITNRDEQTITGQHAEYLPDGSIKKRTWQLRWSTPLQLDLMAEQAGLMVWERYSDWNCEPYSESSTKHVTVYRARGVSSRTHAL